MTSPYDTARIAPTAEPESDYMRKMLALHAEDVERILRLVRDYLGFVRADEDDRTTTLRHAVEDALDALRPPTPIPSSSTLHDDTEGHAR
jgi:signal transduction histidine kinase